MKSNVLSTAAVGAGLLAAGVAAQTACASVLVPSYSPPSVAPGWSAQLVVNGLKKPRSIQFDAGGGLLVVESGKGITRFTFKDNGGTCLAVDQAITVVADTTLNHGLALANDGKTLYASNVEAVFAWAYDPARGALLGDRRAVVANMSNNDLTTRTLLMSQAVPGQLVVSRGSAENYDVDALNKSSGLSQIRAFDLARLLDTHPPYNFNADGRVLGWGLRNSVGVGEHPKTGAIYSVENSIDGVKREGSDIDRSNPGEELNYHGFLNGTTAGQGGNYGYPNCFAVWDTNLPGTSTVAGGLHVGDQFSLVQNATLNDTTCAQQYVAPRLTLPAHFAPLDILFGDDGAQAYVSFHGSFDKTNPQGYRVSTIDFDPQRGTPLEPPSSTRALSRDIISNPGQAAQCPANCFRPVGLAWGPRGRLFVTSDTTGEIYVLSRDASSSSSSSSGTTATTSGSIVTATGKANGAAAALGRPALGVLGGVAACVVGGLMVL
ncbi:uncharacterized protein E0L32_007523 [Thyridium curvatum]|uniref:Pyrroloquinoline quinone-dependent pyranose dehydrogenase beta-propeller domain-containing protein n=1 Tax=Thyridium curvatum TaxID=1093900 RepID=A0A507AYE1_9PEZI|nr:uncharacterized protein E0L32_007523 [Thyridium curvatum]TPX11786.1 hypothetical protein E0L32_007523 [Thyridium curvatum]